VPRQAEGGGLKGKLTLLMKTLRRSAGA